MPERVLSRTPEKLLEYPLEVMIVGWAALNGPTTLLGITSPGSLGAVLPAPMLVTWAVSLIIAGATVGWGLHMNRLGSTCARGLLLLSSSLAAHGVAVLGFAGVKDGWTTGSFLFMTAAITGFRAWWLRKRTRINLAVREASW